MAKTIMEELLVRPLTTLGSDSNAATTAPQQAVSVLFSSLCRPFPAPIKQQRQADTHTLTCPASLLVKEEKGMAEPGIAQSMCT